MNKLNIPVNTPLLSGNEKKYLMDCIDTGWISSEGPYVKQFEEAFSKVVGRKYSVAVANGSAALDVAVAALGIGPGDEVILPSHTIISCILPIIRLGAKPVLIDSELDSWNMDVSLIEEKITEKTKAIMVVHLYGLPVDMDPVLELAKKYDLYVIEDASQMLGQTYKGKPCGSFGDISTTSFYPNKQITTGEGGMCSVNDPELAERCNYFKNLCFNNAQRFVHEDLGWNYRMTNIQAAIGLAQLEKLDEHVSLKRHVGRLYAENLGSIDAFELGKNTTDYAENIYWVIGVLLKEDSDWDSQKLRGELSRRGVGVRPFFYPMHKQPVFNKQGMFGGESYPASEVLYDRGLYLPGGVGIADEQVLAVCEVVKELLG